MACNEAAPATPIPEYPAPPKVWDEINMRAFISAQYIWGIGAIAAYSSVKADRKATANCLNNLRTRGIIH